nr:DUF4347 domain-containing protein [uncultured Cohaesibacter sp.]
MKQRGKLLYPLEPRIVYDGALAGDLHVSQIDLPADHGAVHVGDAQNNGPIAVEHHLNGGEKLPLQEVAREKQVREGVRDSEREKLAERGHVAKDASQGMPRSVVFVQDNIAQYHRLTESLGRDVDVVLLDSHSDGLRQMATWAARHVGYQAAYIISHGSDGVVDMGSVKLSGQNVGRYARELATIGRSLQPGGDLVLYGCDVAASAKGQMFLSNLSILTGADIAASTDLTGSAEQGGDWTLEWTKGQVEAKSILDGTTAFEGVLDITQIDISSYFNADVVYDTSSGTDEIASFDATGRAFVTQSWAEYKYSSDPDGMADDGIYEANEYHPYVEIAATNDNTGNNAWVLENGETGSYSFDVEDGNYSSLHLFLSAGGVSPSTSSSFSVTLVYSDGTTTTSDEMTVQDWYGEVSQSEDVYYLINGMDRMESKTKYSNANDPAIFGFKIDVDQSKTLVSITINITENDAGYVAFFGATAVSESGTDLDDVTTSEGTTWTVIDESNTNLEMYEDTTATVSGITIVDGEGLSLTTTLSVDLGTIDVVDGSGATVTGDGTGTVTISGTQDQINAAIASISYTPEADGEGDDYTAITMTTTDGYSTDVIEISVDVIPVNDDPVAVDDADSVYESGVVSGSELYGNVLVNDKDVDANDTKTVTAVAGGDVGETVEGTYGSLIINSHGSYSYVVDDDNSTVDALSDGETLVETFSYTMADSTGATSTATLTITIYGSNDAPDAVNDVATIEVGGDADKTSTGNVLENDSDVEGSSLTVSAIDGGSLGSDVSGSYGTLVLNADGSYSYEIDSDNASVIALSGSDTLTETFTYTVSDEEGATSTATLTVTIEAHSDTPTVVDDAAEVTEAGQNAGTQATGNVLSNDSASDSDNTLAVTAIDGGTVDGETSGSYGTLILNSDGSYSYVVDNSNATVDALNDGETLTESFTYTVTESNGTTATATLVITINGQNDAPDSVNDNLTISWSGSSEQQSDIAYNFADAESGSELDYALASDTPSWLSISPDGVLEGTIPDGSSGTVTVTIYVTDEDGATLSYQLTLNYANKTTVTTNDPDPTPDGGGTGTEPDDPYEPEDYTEPETILDGGDGDGGDAGDGDTGDGDGGNGVSSSAPMRTTQSDDGSDGDGSGSGDGDALSDGSSVRASQFEVKIIERAAGNSELVVNEIIEDQTFDADSDIVIHISHDAFAHTDENAIVTLSLQMQDGSQVPSWLAFDPQTGTIHGTPPKGFHGDLLLKVTAKDDNGYEVSQSFHLIIGDGAFIRSPDQQGSTDGDGSLSDALAQAQPGLFEQMQGLSGRSHLSEAEQLQQALNETNVI